MAALEDVIWKLFAAFVTDSVSAADGSFVDELARTEFSIFDSVADLGYFSWKPNNSNYKALSSIKSKEEILCQGLELPKRFESPVPRTHDNKFPYGQTDIACLHVASRHCGVDLYEWTFALEGQHWRSWLTRIQTMYLLL